MWQYVHVNDLFLYTSQKNLNCLLKIGEISSNVSSLASNTDGLKLKRQSQIWL